MTARAGVHAITREPYLRGAGHQVETAAAVGRQRDKECDAARCGSHEYDATALQQRATKP
jgi:hypothetical protein